MLVMVKNQREIAGIIVNFPKFSACGGLLLSCVIMSMFDGKSYNFRAEGAIFFRVHIYIEKKHI